MLSGTMYMIQIVILHCFYHTVNAEFRQMHFIKNTDRRLLNVTETRVTSTALGCGGICVGESWCRAFNYRTEEKLCQLCQYESGQNFININEAGCDLYIFSYEDATCMSGWTKFNQSCYFVDTVQQNQSEAKASCERYDPTAHLVRIQTKEQQAFVTGLLNISLITEDFYWLDAVLNDTAAVYEYSDGTSFTGSYPFWGSNEPSNVATEKCVALYRQKGFLWVDQTCDFNYAASVCEYPLIKGTTAKAN